MKTLHLKTVSMLLCMLILFSLLPVVSFAENYSIQLDVPVIPQESGSTCADASARECIAYYVQHGFGTTVPSEAQLVSQYGIVDPSVIKNALNNYCGVSFGEGKPATKEAVYNLLRNSISNGNPVVLDVCVVAQSVMDIFGYRSEGHYIVASGLNKYSDNIDDILVTIKDPWHGTGANHGQTVYVPLLHIYNICRNYLYETNGLIIPISSEMTNGAGQTIPDGDYIIATAKNSDYYLDIEGSDYPAEDGANVQLGGPRDDAVSPCDAWTVTYIDDGGFYTIYQKGTEISLDVSGGGAASGANIQVYSANDSNAQKWSIAQNSDGSYRIDAKCSGFCLDFAGGNCIAGVNVQQWESNNSDAQQWTFIPYSEEPPCEHSYTPLDYVLGKIKKPTLTEGGYFTYRCTICGEEIVENYPALNNTDYAVERVESTCTEAGYDEYTYLGDDAFHLSFTVDLPLGAHQYESVNVPPVAGKPGYLMHICSVCGDSYKEYYSDNWTEWSETYPSGVDASLIESKTQYRAKTRETTTSSSSSLDGWTLYDTQQVWDDYGEWSPWSTVAVTPDDSTEVETTALYRYYYFYCPVCGRHEPLTGMSDCGQYTLRQDENQNDAHEGWFTTPYNQSSYQAFGYANKYYTTSLGDGQVWCFSGGNLNSTEIGTRDADSDAIVITTGYRYRTRTQSTVYCFERWTDWSEWGDQVEIETDDKEVETRTVYRYAVIPSEHPDNLIVIPAGTSVIQEESFYGINAEYVYVPASVTEIKSLAFAACPNLKVVYFESGNNIAVAENFVSGCNRMLVIDALDGSTVANNINTYRQYLSDSTT